MKKIEARKHGKEELYEKESQTTHTKGTMGKREKES
jgi:hypothetical protein